MRSQMKFGILRFPGGHGDQDLSLVLNHHFGAGVQFTQPGDHASWNVDMLLLPGGIPCNQPDEHHNCSISEQVAHELNLFAATGRMILGVGSGFELLCEAGLLPGRLVENSTGRFICRQIFIKPDNMHDPLTAYLKDEKAYRIPMATYRGCYEANEEELIELRKEDQIIFRFCDYAGRITESVNYTGSVDNIAGISNREKNILGMIPQPERAALGSNDQADGWKLLKSLISVAGKYVS